MTMNIKENVRNKQIYLYFIFNISVSCSYSSIAAHSCKNVCSPSEEMSNFSKLVLGWQVCQIQSTTYGHDGQTNPNFV